MLTGRHDSIQRYNITTVFIKIYFTDYREKGVVKIREEQRERVREKARKKGGGKGRIPI